jgi:hypothetical protein
VKASAVAALLCVVLAAVATRAEAGPGAAMRFRTEVVRDPMSNGIEAIRMLVPDGWVRRGGVVWNLRYSNVASVSMTVTDAAHHQELQVFPAIPQVWDPGRYLGPPGTNYLGMEVRRPVSAAALVEGLIVPAFRGGLRPAVVSEVRLPKVAAALTARGRGAVTSSTYDAARVRIAYTADGRAMEEDVYAVVSYTTSPALPGTTMWQPQILYSFRAPRGKLDGAARVLQTMVASVRPSLKWYAGYQYVFDLWVKGQMQAIDAAGQLSRQIAAASDSISRSTSDACRAQQDSYDRVYGELSNGIRGVETYENPFEGRTVELPNDHRYDWVSSTGQYALSDSAGFDPNVGSTVEWRLLKTR